MLMPKYLRKVGRRITLTLLDLPSLIQAGHQKKPDAWITANFSLIGKPNGYAVLPGTPAEIGGISQTDMASRVFGSDFPFRSVDLVLFMINVPQLQPKYLSFVQMKLPITPSKMPENVRKRLNFDLFTQSVLELKEPS